MNGFITSGNAQIYYEVYGNGEPLVFLHGNSENLRYFDKQISFFSQYYKVIAIDSRAHGQSTRGDGSLNFWVMAEDIIAVLNHLSVEMATIIGFSDGGNIALHVALTAPERLRRLILVGANIFPKGMKKKYYAGVLVMYFWRSIAALLSQKARTAKERIALMVFHPRLTAGQIAKIDIPSLVIAGEHDMICEKHTRLIAKSLKNAMLLIVPAANHFVASCKPDLFNNIIDNFLKI